MSEVVSLSDLASSFSARKSLSNYTLDKSIVTKEAKHAEAFVKTVKVYSRVHKDKVITVGDLVLLFDVNGYADCPEGSVSLVELLMAFNPNQYELVAETAVSEPQVTEPAADGSDSSDTNAENTDPENVEVSADGSPVKKGKKKV